NYLIEACEHLITAEISKKTGFVRSEIVGGTFSFSARGVITLDISLRADEIDIPYTMALTAFQFRITHMLATRYNMTLEQAYLFISNSDRDPIVLQLLDEIIAEGQWVFLIREPTINLASIEVCRIRRYKFDDDTISLPQEPLPGFNADFDGDQLNLCFLIDKNIHKEFEPFHLSCMT
ncbi:RpoC, partial [human gut metagenome]